MYILDFFNGFPNHQSEEKVFYEYRLLCSGELYNGNVITYDWRKSDIARILFDSPFMLIVCKKTHNKYPQELALRFSLPSVTENKGNASFSFYPDNEIARDIAALLTLLCRRLITVTVKTRENHPSKSPHFQDCPFQIVNSLHLIHWERKPLEVIEDSDGVSEIIDYNPQPKGVDSVKLIDTLVKFSHLPYAESLVLSARLYSLALQLFEKDIDIAYQLLIAAVETAADGELSKFTPTDEEKIKSKKAVAVLAKKYGLSTEQANQLAIAACQGIPWASRKFTKFIIDNTTEELWKKDDLFEVPENFLPLKENFEASLIDIYKARGKLTHGGHSFPPSSVFGVRPGLPVEALMSFDWTSLDKISKPFPPIVWFERVVNNALNSFIERSVLSAFGKESPDTNPDITS